MENWKTINGFSNYEISDLGRVRRKTTKKILSQKLVEHNGKRYTVRLTINNKRIELIVHRLVAYNFLPNYYNKPQVDHINRNTLDNRVYNLRWVSAMENNLNKTVSSLSTTGKKGVSVNLQGNNKYYLASINIDGKRQVKSFKSYEDAVKWRDEHVKIYYNDKYYTE